MKKSALKVLSYVLVALAASAVTMTAVLFSSWDGYSKLEQLEDLILDKFIGEADRTIMEDAAADAMVNALGDRWSYYLTAEEYKAHMQQASNSYVGIGVTIQVRQDGTGLNIIKVTAGGPAELAGVLAGDVMVRVEGQSIAGLSTREVKKMIQGKAGTEVKLGILRNGAEMEFTVKRAKIRVPVATAKMLEGNIGLVTIENFNSCCADETIAAIESLVAQGAQKLIFDVRNNPGGYQKELVEVLDYLLPEGVIFRSEYYTGQTSEDYSDAQCVDLPMAVLVNADSYSAAEFFAAALKDFDRAVVVGEQTCGKGYFQNTFQLRDGSAVGLSIGKYYTPKGEHLAGVGITPDKVVEVSEELAKAIYAGALEPEEDPQIQAAVQALKTEQ